MPPVPPREPSFERRTRIVCHFPLNRKPDKRRPNQLFVIRDFIRFLKKSDLTGFSMSSMMDTVFTGFWRARPSHEFEEENVTLLMIDHPLDRHEAALWEFVARIRTEIQRLYLRHTKEREKDVWIVLHPIDRLL